MRIEQISSSLLSLPMDKPYSSSVGWIIGSVGHVMVEARTDEGHVGVGYARSLHEGKLPAIRAAIDDVKSLAIGKDPYAVKSIWRSMMASNYWFGPGGLINFAISAIDIALWDLLGKVTGKPLHALLGGGRDRVPCYYTGFRRSTPASELGAEAELLRAQGLTAFKIKVGAEDSLDKEIERVRAVREAIGNDLALMIDPNRAWSADTTIEMGERLEEYNLYWLEDPIPYEDMEGRARVAACLDVPIASGEDMYTKAQFRDLAEHKAADIFNVDLQRVGGVTGWLEVTSFLEARDLPFAGHWFSEIQCHLFAAAEKGLTLEYMPWHFGLFKQGPKIENGLMEVPKGPGLGWEIDEEAVERYGLK